MNINYYINGLKFRDLNVHVELIKGLIDPLERKKPVTFDWAEINGHFAELDKTPYEARKITLNCWVNGNNWGQMKNSIDLIFRELDKKGRQLLIVDIPEDQPGNFVYGSNSIRPSRQVMPYLVYRDQKITLNKFIIKGDMVWKFNLNLIEPNPVKKVFRTSQKSVRISLNSQNDVEFYYQYPGNFEIRRGTMEAEIKEFEEKRERLIICAGQYEDLKTINIEGASVLWNRL